MTAPSFTIMQVDGLRLSSDLDEKNFLRNADEFVQYAPLVSRSSAATKFHTVPMVQLQLRRRPRQQNDLSNSLIFRGEQSIVMQISLAAWPLSWDSSSSVLDLRKASIPVIQATSRL
jgi:hypothetical protein